MSADISTYLDKVKAAITAHFGDLVDTVEHEAIATDSSRKINTPAILIGVSQIDEGIDPGTEETPIVLQVSLFCVLSSETPKADVEIMNFAAAVLAMVRNNRWAITSGIGKPQRVSAQPALFSPVKEGLPCWEVSFEQALDYGDSVWAPDPDFVEPTEVYLGHDPLIGTPNEPHYRRVVPVYPEAEV